jgi:signal transduction histidine kinase
MQDVLSLPRRIATSRRLSWAAIGMVLALLGSLIFFGTVRLRQTTRAQIASRDAAILHAVALAQQLAEENDGSLGDQIEHVADQFTLALQLSRLKGVIAARLFDGSGQFITAFPASVTEAPLAPADLARLRELKPVSRYDANAALTNVFLATTPALTRIAPRQPLLEVTIPFHRAEQSQLLGAVQFVMDGHAIAAEFATLDQNLFRQAALGFAGGALLVVLALGLAFQRLQAVNRQLVERSTSLLRANEELALAAKTSAVGAVTSHLIHGLSSPLTGLQNLVAQRSASNRETSDTEWQHAIALTRQMQTMIGEIVRVLREQQGGQQYELTLAELVEILADRTAPLARAAQVRFSHQATGAATLTNRDANLLLLILENLIRNAIEATPAQRAVRLTVTAAASGIQFEVHDEGPGLPAAIQEHLFQPCRSTKPQGNGIGLAICQQLAHHLGARLELSRSSAQGCVFTLQLPRQPAATNR